MKTPANCIDPLSLAQLSLQTMDLLPYSLVALATLCGLFVKNPWVWRVLLGAALVAALFWARLSPLGLVWILSLAGLLALSRKGSQSHALKFVWVLAATVLATLISLRLLPGFHNLRLFSDLQLSPGASPHSIWLNLDKPVVGLLVLGIGFAPLGSVLAWKDLLKKTLQMSLFGIPLVLLTAYVLGYVNFDPKFPEVFWIWAAVNLLGTCVGEEALFRGLIQRTLVSRLGSQWGVFVGIFASSLLFGLAHFAGGPTYVFLATLAGILYGFVFHRTGHLAGSIFCHFLLNATHFLLFTYPALA